jgi:hypothetical protein
MSYPKCRSVEVINNPTRPGSNLMEVNYNDDDDDDDDDDDELKRTLRCKINVNIKQ